MGNSEEKQKGVFGPLFVDCRKKEGNGGFKARQCFCVEELGAVKK